MRVLCFLRIALTFAAAAVCGWPPFNHVSAQSLSWQDCVEDAARNNPDLKGSGHSLRATEFNLQGAYSGYLPQLSAELGSTRMNSASSGLTSRPQFGGEIDSLDSSGDGSRTLNTASLSLTQNIFSGFQTDAQVEQAAAERAVSMAGLDIVRAQVSFDLKSAFAGLVYSQNYLDLTGQIIERRRENLRLVELRYQSGNENKGSYLLSKAALSEAEFDSLQAGNLIRVSRQQLSRVLGREESEGLNVSGKVPESEPPAHVEFEDLVLSTPQDRRARAQKDAADAGIKQAKSQFFPSLDAGGQVSRRGGRGFDDSDRWQVGVALSLPLFSGGRDYYAVKSAQENAAAALSNRFSESHQVLVGLKEAFSGFVESVERVKVNRGFVEAAAARAEIGRAKYNNGLISFENWDIIENDLITRRKNMLRSEYERTLAEAEWEKVQGWGVFK